MRGTALVLRICCTNYQTAYGKQNTAECFFSPYPLLTSKSSLENKCTHFQLWNGMLTFERYIREKNSIFAWVLVWRIMSLGRLHWIHRIPWQDSCVPFYFLDSKSSIIDKYAFYCFSKAVFSLKSKKLKVCWNLWEKYCLNQYLCAESLKFGMRHLGQVSSKCLLISSSMRTPWQCRFKNICLP